MAWNHRSAVVAVAIAIQVAEGAFTTPTIPDDLIAVSVPNNNYESLTADDPTATGTIWKNRRIYLGKTGTAGATYPLRGYGATLPAANAFPIGRVFQSAGFTEVRNTADIAATFQAGSTTTSVVLAAGASATDDFYIGMPINFALAGTGFRANTVIADYNGSTKTATLAETLGSAPAAAAAYTIKKSLTYVLGTVSTPGPLLSISIWRDKKRYDYMDWRPTAFSIDMPVTNDANAVFPSIDFSGRGKPAGVADDTSPALPSSILSLQPAPVRGGKFVFDQVKLGHQSLRFAIAFDLGAPSNQNQDQGQDSYQTTSGTRTITLDVNQMAVSDLNVDSLCDNQTIFPILSTWGLGTGNNFGAVLPNNVLDPLNPGDRNGFVNLTGDAQPVDADKSFAITIF
jgi:hypothetical protein